MKRIAMLGLVLALSGTAPAPAAAGSCTDGYMACLNESWNLNVILRTIADFECFDDYTVCVSRGLLGL